MFHHFIGLVFWGQVGQVGSWEQVMCPETSGEVGHVPQIQSSDVGAIVTLSEAVGPAALFWGGGLSAGIPWGKQAPPLFMGPVGQQGTVLPRER